jgi:hypothetical protein
MWAFSAQALQDHDSRGGQARADLPCRIEAAPHRDSGSGIAQRRAQLEARVTRSTAEKRRRTAGSPSPSTTRIGAPGSLPAPWQINSCGTFGLHNRSSSFARLLPTCASPR